MPRIDPKKIEAFKNEVSKTIGFLCEKRSEIDLFLTQFNWLLDGAFFSNTNRYYEEGRKAHVILKKIIAKIDEINQLKEEFLRQNSLMQPKLSAEFSPIFRDEFDLEALMPQLDNFKKRCEEIMTRFKKPERGRKAMEPIEFIALLSIEASHIFVFHKNGSLYPTGYYILTVQNALNELGIVISPEAVKKRLLTIREHVGEESNIFKLKSEAEKELAGKFIFEEVLSRFSML
jgi:hypothetical protein